MPDTKTRIVGSGFTSFNYMGQPIAFLDGFSDTGQEPVAPAAAVHPLNSKHPVEIATARAVGAGTLSLTIRELWNEPVWWQLAGMSKTYDIIDVYQAIAANPAEVTCQMLIKPPGGSTWRGKTYHGCVITQIADDETVALNALTFPRIITVMYTHTTPVSVSAGR